MRKVNRNLVFREANIEKIAEVTSRVGIKRTKSAFNKYMKNSI
jgi:hypothetical protein